MKLYKKTGYLNSEFEIFHIIDKNKKCFSYHYHDFYKVLIFISGNVSYHIEGKSYSLKDYDIVLVNPSEIHKPVIHDNSPYERIIIYLSPDFFNSYKEKGFDLSYCFNNVKENKSNIIRFKSKANKLYNEILDLCDCFNNNDSLNELYKKVIFVKFMILLNNSFTHNFMYIATESTSNKKILEVLSYINDNLTSNINIDTISSRFYLNKSYLMHLFKKETGYTLIQYINEKRLFKAKNLILNGCSLTDACFNSGFNNYSTFFRAFKNKFNVSPKEISSFNQSLQYKNHIYYQLQNYNK